MFVPCFDVQCFVSFPVLQSSLCGRESLLLCFVCLPRVVLWLYLTKPWVGLQWVIVIIHVLTF